MNENRPGLKQNFAFRVENNDIVSLVNKSCSQLFFLYAGGGRFGDLPAAAMGMRSIRFLRKAEIANRNVTIVRDPHTENYERGISGDISNLPSLIEWHQQHCRDLAHVSDAYCLGSSMGGYAAMLFGYHLKAKTIWAFGPRVAPAANAKECEKKLIDLLSTSNGVTEYRIYFAPGDPRDRSFADTLAGCPGIVLCPRADMHSMLGWNNHLVLASLAFSGDLPRIFPPFASAKVN